MKMNYRNVRKEQAVSQSDQVGETGINHKEVYDEEKKRILIRDYVNDRKSVILLFLSTSLVYIIICSLYQLHNLSKILYAFLITLFIWCCYASFDLTRYIQKRRKLRLARNYPELTAEALFGAGIPDIFPRREGEQYTITQQLSELEKAYVSLIDDLCRSHRAMESEVELRLGEMTDYYMMWAHQIKTPIAGIKLLINGREDGFLLMEELFKIEQYVEMVLHYLRLESMASDTIIKQHDLQSLVKQTVRKYSVLFINSGLSLQLEDFSVKVLTDEKWLCFVLEQIISNSIKYTKKGTISIYMKPDAQKTLVIEDTGIGIRQEDIPRIFDRGFTGYNGHLDKKSTGIGLYLCKQIMNQLSHGISVSSKEGEGTKFYLELSRDSYVKHAD